MMLTFKLVFAAVILAFGISAVTGQTPPPAGGGPSNAQAKTFSSIDGGFTINLPSNISKFEGIDPVPNVSKGGNRFIWTANGMFFNLGYLDRILEPGQGAKLLDQMAAEYIASMQAKNSSLVRREEYFVDGYRGVAVTMSNGIGTGQLRYLLVKERLFILVTAWPATQDGAREVKILESFRLLDGPAIIAQRLAEATPAPLPQTPAVKRVRSDAADELLRGPVKSVVETTEDLDGTGSSVGVNHTHDYFYDGAGYLLKTISYDYRGNPRDVTVYGFIDGKRVLKRGNFLTYEYDPPPMMAPPGSAPATPAGKPADPRYDSSIQYKYDAAKRLIEEVRFNNRGEAGYRSTSVYAGANVTESSFDQQGKLTFKTLSFYDSKGQLTQKTYFSMSASSPADSVYNYETLAVDRYGNWTKRKVRGKSAQYGGGTKDLYYFEYRTISYY